MTRQVSLRAQMGISRIRGGFERVSRPPPLFLGAGGSKEERCIPVHRPSPFPAKKAMSLNGDTPVIATKDNGIEYSACLHEPSSTLRIVPTDFWTLCP